VEVVGIALAKNGQIGWCFDELDEWGLGLFGEIRACGSGFRTEEMLVRDFVRGRSDKRSPAAPFVSSKLSGGLSRRDQMMVARQFIAWDVSKEGDRPVGTV